MDMKKELILESNLKVPKKENLILKNRYCWNCKKYTNQLLYRKFETSFSICQICKKTIDFDVPKDCFFINGDADKK